MAVLDVSHPDIGEFIDAKQARSLEYFNLSVAVTSRFMRAVTRAGPHRLVNPRTRPSHRHGGRGGTVRPDLRRGVGRRGPGLLFTDRINRDNRLSSLGRIEATNPCGEVPLLPYESCNLGSLNLARFVAGRRVNFARLRAAVRLTVRFLDDVIDVSRYPVPELEGPARAARKVGLGVMGLAEMLATLGVPARSSPSPLPGRSPAPQCRSTTPTAAAVTRTSASSDRRRPEKTKTLILNERWCDDPVPGPSSSGFIGGTGVERDGTRLPPSGAGRPDHGRSAGCVASDHRVSPAHSTTRPARRFPSAGITRVRCWESPSGRSHLASQPSCGPSPGASFPAVSAVRLLRSSRRH